MSDEIKALRKELNELRERVSILESRNIQPHPYLPIPCGAPIDPTIWPDPPYKVTCESPGRK